VRRPTKDNNIHHLCTHHNKRLTKRGKAKRDGGLPASQAKEKRKKKNYKMYT
jgi:hypothetical protein